MKREYDMIAVGTGSAMTLVGAFLEMRPDARVAVIDKDPPGGICLTKGCVPSKLLLYPAEVVRVIREAESLGIRVAEVRPDFETVMGRMRAKVYGEIARIGQAFAETTDIHFFGATAEFIAPYTLRVGPETVSAPLILLTTGSRPHIPDIDGLEEVDYLTSDTILAMERLPKSMAIIGGGYIAAEYGHFFSAMGAAVTIIGRNERFLPDEEPEISETATRKAAAYMAVLTGHEAVGVSEGGDGMKRVRVRNVLSGDETVVEAEALLIATGRSSNTDLLHPERGGVEVDASGWIKTDERLETSQANVWAFGDATGKHLFKHAANYEARIAYYNALAGERFKVSYHAVPHAVFTWPEIASVGMKEAEAVERYGGNRVLIGFEQFENITKGDAMGAEGCFAKVIMDAENERIIGAHVIGPQASVLIQEAVNLMYTPNRDIAPIVTGMHIHPSLSEVMERAFMNLMPRADYREMLERGVL